MEIDYLDVDAVADKITVEEEAIDMHYSCYFIPERWRNLPNKVDYANLVNYDKEKM